MLTATKRERERSWLGSEGVTRKREGAQREEKPVLESYWSLLFKTDVKVSKAFVENQAGRKILTRSLSIFICCYLVSFPLPLSNLCFVLLILLATNDFGHTQFISRQPSLEAISFLKEVPKEGRKERKEKRKN